MRLIFLLPLCVFLTACAVPDPPYRTEPAGEETATLCDVAIQLAPANTEKRTEEVMKCALQRHFWPGGGPVEVPEGAEPGQVVLPANDWTVLAQVAGQPLYESEEYHLAFVELTEDGADYRPFQREKLRQRLRGARQSGQQNYVVAYVHGWRHDAALRDGDVKKFRRMLAYTRAALNTRCIEQGRYCNAALTGVFIGWNGRTVDEGPTDVNEDESVPTSPLIANVVAKFGDRLDLSCKLGANLSECKGVRVALGPSPLRRLLTDIEGRLRPLDPGNPAADKMLVVGHSMGGNMLATMLAEEAEARVRGHGRGTRMQPLVGDLVVLLNPASHASNWSRIQAAERDRADLTGDNRLTCDGDPDCVTKLLRWHNLYPRNQRPVYISLTSTDNWDEGRDVEYDSATKDLFRFAYLGDVTIGHLEPRYISRTAILSRAEGQSHEFAVLEGAQTETNRYATRYKNAPLPDAAWCAPADGWLMAARGGGSDTLAVNWDHGRHSTVLPNVGGRMNGAAIRWRQSLSPAGNSNALSVSSATTPFWNVRALDTAIRGHSGWANYATWCALHQIVLDDITADIPAPVLPPEPEVMAEAAAVSVLGE